MHGTNVTPIGNKPVEEKPRTRTITLTNRAPVKIVEDDWPVMAQGAYDEGGFGAPYEWNFTIRVRYYSKKEPCYLVGQHIIHASYYYTDDDEERTQHVRVGRLVSDDEAMSNLWKHIVEVGEELRTRIDKECMRRHVTHIVDQCFANLPPHLP